MKKFIQRSEKGLCKGLSLCRILSTRIGNGYQVGIQAITFSRVRSDLEDLLDNEPKKIRSVDHVSCDDSTGNA